MNQFLEVGNNMPGRMKPKHRQKKKKNPMTEKNNSAVNKNKKKGKLPIGLRLPPGTLKNIIDHGPEYA